MSHKQTVQDFLHLAFNEKQPEAAVEKYLGEPYTQHNPSVPDGRAGAVVALTGFVRQFPELSLEIRRVVAEGDLVVTHSLMKLSPTDRGSAVADVFRLDGDRIVEHWDVLQQVPESSANGNAMV
ncbi:nuclear transport factor 2 family protein [Actinocrispum wychmicini]|uniref:Putative SnoaL-like aldol condensation-catalyzing enzyme n=1 Tax=Actinocrispum wychmicini TaxID=1213861 RepID=A0A4R2JLQ9_9PSEU|nr:nuclear transport factor 2 family protein [Actinocrispum wychmicini]TCO59807.1 putative SnoaL-like aldol condensation-catalyzing enzyme [Actinocrispum wychmicini]